MSENQRLLLAISLSMMVLLVWQIFFAPQQQNQENALVEANQPAAFIEQEEKLERDVVVANDFSSAKRIPFSNNNILGSVNLVGGRIDDLQLLNYQDKLTEGSSNVSILSPSNCKSINFVEFGWLSSDKLMDVPNSKTIWSTNSTELTPNSPIELFYVNSTGVEFHIKISVDDKYMFHVQQKVVNDS